MENRRKLLLYRSWHRGCKETDLLLGDFAKKKINSFTMEELAEYENIVNMDDSHLYKLLTSKIKSNNSKIINEIIKFNQEKEII
ncbi:MAG: succinate dehydrogenase assembly factor 2 [Rickettsiaceae bacterium H1]|nr:succinate dehydrogenase assembly factor 2 [Rickettsiaceae bacterium H1]